MKPYYKTNLPILFLLMAICHIMTFCSRRFQPQLSQQTNNIHDIPITDKTDSCFPGIETHAREKLQDIRSLTASKASDTLKTLADKIIMTARNYLGIPHCMGGITTQCLDCSGFVMIVFEEFGIDLPHNAQEQSKQGKLIKEKNDLMKGDLVFFHGTYKTSRYITHSGVYIGDNRFIHTSVGKGVTITSLDDTWWKGKYAFGTRILN
ncbi:MAG TPA: C40 family peptidase [Bacteroidales bacterium]|nr:C40 family peptidase [Bacteroidales bacterium]